MVKIKLEKKMDLAELIQWAWDNPKLSKGKVFTIHKNDEDLFLKVAFNHAGNMSLSNSIGDCPTNNNLFSVEVEEEITEETKIPVLLEICTDFDSGRITSYVSKNRSIPRECDEDSIAFHMVNPDGTTTLLWTREEGMVK